MVPIMRDVDVLVVGAASGAVASALELQQQGLRIMVVSDLSYFGEESAGTLACAPLFPCAVKRGLEESLLKARIPFIYLVRPVALLRDEEGRIAGAVLAARTSLFAVTCRAVVDATRFGVVARLAGAQARPRSNLPSTVSWNVIAKAMPVGGEELTVPFMQGDKVFRTFRMQMNRCADPFSREHAARAALVDGNVLTTADILEDVPDVDFAAVPDVFSPGDTRGIEASVSRSVKPIMPVHGNYGFAAAFLRNSMGALDVSPAGFPVLGCCDVVVVGGGTGGASAGIAAARDGAKTIVLEMQHGLGGVGTMGLITAYWFGNRVGFTRELDDAVSRLDGVSRETQGRSWSPEIKAAVLSRMLYDAGGAAWLGSYAFGVRLDGNRVDGVLVSTPYGAGLLEVGSVVDATGNADVAAAAGAPCRVIMADHVATQGTGLSPRVHPGTTYNNSDHTFVDETDPEGVTHAFATARAKFPDAFDTTPIVDSRERRQVYGELELSPLDILARRAFPDTVVTAISNFDTHGFIVHPVFMVAIPDHDALQVHVPFRCMVPKGVEGVLVTGLGVSAHRDALPVIRMQADVQNQGFAAGMAAATVARGSRRFRDMDIRALQRRLVAMGNLAPEVLMQEDSFPLDAQAIRKASAGKLTEAINAAILFACPDQSRSLLAGVMRDDASRRLDAATILGLMGFMEAAPVLAATVRDMPWDEGWNYRGMGQFGACLSRLDVLILALAGTAAKEAVPLIEAKIRQLDGTAAFSHCRAVAVAAAGLRDARLAGALADLLQMPSMQGHAHLDTVAVVCHANGDDTETAARNLSLRELHLARGLFLAGDSNGVGRKILATYTQDLRGHYARHARAVTECIL